ncbi:flavodoxin domain-containing protein [Paenibacillus zanthoxyli]|uniref:flavodoxin domain-containing protein n=1 Tax=Paenibacillus zanthoxyli TaxID=369399 RepID=UPI000471EF67|nr:flavodoxin domain-containing protein [Paenibacillus zanthoxyli]
MKAIILYTSRHGCAEQAALALQSRMGEGAETVNLMHTPLPSLAGFDTVILGGSIYYGKIQKRMSEFVDREITALADKRIGLFICAGESEDKAGLELLRSFPESLYLQAKAAEVLGSEVKFSKLSLAERLVYRAVTGKSGDRGEIYTNRIDHFVSKLL